MRALPMGTVTFLFTDIEGSTRLLQDLRDRYPDALEAHRRLLRTATQQAGGYEFETQGDGLFTAFPSASDALRAAIAAQRALHEYHWPEAGKVRVRMGLHTGQPTLTESGYVGLDLHRTARICTAGHGGQILLSQTTHDLVEDDLADSVDLRDMGEHRLKDLTRPQHLYQVVAPDLPTDFLPIRSLDALPNNLPIQLTSFIGREREKAEVKRLLSTARLVTLTGPGGAGKTRLALQAAAEAVDEFKDGVWLVELAPLFDPLFVPKAVTSALGVTEQPNRLLTETIRDYLRSRSLLLILDNCEHLLQECAQLADALVRKCPNLRMLATSREPLGIAGEFTYRVPSLALPDLAQQHSLETLTKYEGVQLFVERALASAQEFAVTRRNAPAVVQVCQRLDGIPLAIELAAARVKVLSVEQIAQRLDDRFHLLTGGSRTALPRHQTLRAAMDWSYDLLAEKERALLRSLSVFAGGWTLEAAEAVCPGDGVEPADILDLLTQLVEKSLVLVEGQDGETRYRLLEIVRQYALERLPQSGEELDVRRRHRKWYLELAERLESQPWDMREREERLNRLEVERDNFRVALDWSFGTEAADESLRLLGALGWFWEERGYWIDGRRQLEQGLSGARDASTFAKAKVTYAAGVLAYRQDDNKTAARLCQESATLYRELDDKFGIAQSLTALGQSLGRLGDHERGLTLLREGLLYYRELGNKWGIARALNNLAFVSLLQRNYKEAERFHKESLVLAREVADKAIISNTLCFLGMQRARQGDYGNANAMLEESLALGKRSARQQHANALVYLGIVARLQGNYNRGLALQGESLTLVHELGHKWAVGIVLAEFGALASSLGDYDRAARLGGAAESLFDAVGRPGESSAFAPMLDHAGAVATARHALGDQTFAGLWAEGRAMTIEQAIEYALSKDATDA